MIQYIINMPKELSPILKAAAEITQSAAETGADLSAAIQVLDEELRRESKKGGQHSSTRPQESKNRS